MQQPATSKRAFTLTELLVVVVILGILAMVSLPKFSKMIETRKVTEAEDVMRAIKTEQERRCTLDKNYYGDLSSLKDLVPALETNHFSYTALTGGVMAQSKGKLNYQLKMPSYPDGRLCCMGNDCLQLNKDYLSCDALLSRPDFVPAPVQCEANLPVPQDPSSGCSGEPESQEEPCPAGMCGKRILTQVCNQALGVWEWGNNWQDNCHKLQDPTTQEYTKPCDSGSGEATRICTTVYSCDGNSYTSCGPYSGCYKWVLAGMGCQGACSGDGECPPPGDHDCTPPDNASCSAQNLNQVLKRYSSACAFDPDAGHFGEGGFAISFCDYKCVQD